MDFSILHALNRFLAGNDAVEDPLLFYVTVSQLLFVALLLAALLAGGRGQAARRRGGILAAVSTPLALGIAMIVSRIVDRPRPFVAHPGGVELFTKHAADPGFPSDHATASFAIATALMLYDRRWGTVALALATLLAAGRVALGVHYPTDVIAGAVLGASVAALCWWIARRPLQAVADRMGAVRCGWMQRARLIRGSA
jgi:undecaprenyl-diphosphatase